MPQDSKDFANSEGSAELDEWSGEESEEEQGDEEEEEEEEEESAAKVSWCPILFLCWNF